MAYNLVCVHPFANYEKGQLVTDKDEMEKLTAEREQNFVRVAAPDVVPEEVKVDEKSPASVRSTSTRTTDS